MIKYKYIVPIAVALLGLATYILNTGTKSAEIVEEEIYIEPVLTKFDSLTIQYDSILTKQIDSIGVVGAAVAICYKGEIAFLKCYGVKKWGEDEPINENTVFRLASVSKTVSGVLAGKLSEEKIIPLDEKINHYLPEFKLRDSVNTDDLSIRHILSHTSGLVPHAYDNLVEAQVSMDVIIDSLQRVHISAAPGRLYGYQNVVFSLYDTITALATGKAYTDLLKEKVFKPFGMDEASADYLSFESNPNKAYPHTGSNKHYRVLRLNNRYYNTKPAAGINASISDMAHFLLALTDTTNTLNEQYALDEVLAPQVLSPLRSIYLRQWDGVQSKHYGLGWRIIGYHDKQIAYHGGYVQGYRAEIALCREDQVGIVYLSNSPGRIGSWSIPTFLDMFFEQGF